MCKTIFVVSQWRSSKHLQLKVARLNTFERIRGTVWLQLHHIFFKVAWGQGPGAKGVCVCVCVCVCAHALVFPSCIGCCQMEPILCVPSRVLICELHEDGDSWGVEGLSAWKNSSQSSGLHLKDTDRTNYTTDSIRTFTQKSLGCLICWFPQLTPEEWKLKCSHSVVSNSLRPHGL